MFLIPLLYLAFVQVIAFIRRAHDINRTGHLTWLMLISWINLILLVYLVVKQGSDEPNRFGLDVTNQQDSGPETDASEA
jgi:uncharacterized membrane protein YhaH (DUF805 family)